ncbi:hypothetical protein JCM33374_g5876 [Metschnikowia sp. JCM 33374]|nr:hypothetical protein JCM33374_g5876 [Metschnikowia sp. JCM 33374]
MTSQLNNSNENQDQMLQETETLRPVFFDSSSNRGSVSVGPSSEKAKRARLDASVITPNDHASSRSEMPSRDESSSAGPHDPLPSSSTPLDINRHHRHILLQHQFLNGRGGDSNDSSSIAGSGVAESPVSQFPASKFPASTDPHSPVPVSSTSSSTLHFPPAPKENKPSYESTFGRRNSATRPSHVVKKSSRVPVVSSAAATNFNKAPKLFRRFRSRSLPIISYTARAHLLQRQMFPTRPLKNGAVPPPAPGASTIESSHKHSSSLQHKNVHPSKNLSALSTAVVPSLPPINLQSLKEIDLQEILKNPQLRHDILFDPQLQFRPNLDGDRGRRKKSVIERYWAEIEIECKQFFEPSITCGAQSAKIQRLPALFTTLRDILLSLLPVKDRAPVNEIMDMDLVVQQLSRGSFDFVAMAHWLGEVFKSHCAPMRDQWVSEMISKFQEAGTENSVVKLVQGLRSIFSILEAMKLDVANHQIRILRPVLIETAVDFERDYFNQLIVHCKIHILDSLKWFHRGYQKKCGTRDDVSIDEFKSILTSSIIELLSCRNMATEFPSTLAFDHTRLVLLRADVRQLVCVQLCVVLFKQLISNYELAVGYRAASLSVENITKVQEEILAIVTDEHGNVKWTRNIRAIAIQLVKNVVNDPSNTSVQSTKLPQPMIDFSYNWLIKQIQPSSDVYGLMEGKIFKDLLNEVGQTLSSDTTIPKTNADFKLGNNKSGFKHKKSDSEMSGISGRISTLMKFHWNVFGDYYIEYIRNFKQS